jgi:hypothetical protein
LPDATLRAGAWPAGARLEAVPAARPLPGWVPPDACLLPAVRLLAAAPAGWRAEGAPWDAPEPSAASPATRREGPAGFPAGEPGDAFGGLERDTAVAWLGGGWDTPGIAADPLATDAGRAGAPVAGLAVSYR